MFHRIKCVLHIYLKKTTINDLKAEQTIQCDDSHHIVPLMISYIYT